MKDTLTFTGEIEQKSYSTDKLISQFDNWNSLSDTEKLDKLRSVESDDSETVFNVTTTNFHEYLVDSLDPSQTRNLDVQYVALGTDSGSGTSVSDTSLNNEVFTKQITDETDNGTELLTSTFVASDEANGETLNEIGVYTGDPANSDSDNDIFLINHATFSDVVKDSNRTITFDVTLTFSDQ